MKDIGFEVCKIEAMGWIVERYDDAGNFPMLVNKPEFRASQGGFKTLWRPTIEQCRKDVESIVKARKEQTSVPF